MEFPVDRYSTVAIELAVDVTVDSIEITDYASP